MAIIQYIFLFTRISRNPAETPEPPDCCIFRRDFSFHARKTGGVNSAKMKSDRVVIVGGGVIGLCSAYYALKRGFALPSRDRARGGGGRQLLDG